MASLLLASSTGASANEFNEIVVRQGNVAVTQRDVLNALETYVPEASRADLLASEKRVRDFVAQLFATRKLAQEARTRALSPDEQWKIDNAGERAAAQVQLDHLVSARQNTDFAAAAHEYYVANPQEFASPEQVRAQHILIRSENRPSEEARMLAAHVLELAKEGTQSFAELAAEYSEDDATKGKDGNLGTFGRGRMVKPFEDAVFKLRHEGDLAGPVETEFGYHVIRLQEHFAANTIPFDNVKEKLMRDEAAKSRRATIAREYDRVGREEGVEVDQDAIRALVQPIDFSRKMNAPAE